MERKIKFGGLYEIEKKDFYIPEMEIKETVSGDILIDILPFDIEIISQRRGE